MEALQFKRPKAYTVPNSFFFVCELFLKKLYAGKGFHKHFKLGYLGVPAVYHLCICSYYLKYISIIRENYK